MKVEEFAKKSGFTVLTEKSGFDKEVSGVYVCDLLSWVMSHAKKGDAWITIHTHVNIVAVALLAETPCVIIPEGIEVEKATIEKAKQEDIAILCSKMPAYETCLKLHQIIGSGS